MANEIINWKKGKWNDKLKKGQMKWKTEEKANEMIKWRKGKLNDKLN